VEYKRLHDDIRRVLVYPLRVPDEHDLDPVIEFDAYTEACLAQGRAEGAEQERQHIIDKAEQGIAEIGHIVEWTEFEGDVFIIPASVLAPKGKLDKKEVKP
jgi:hypothetical protein